jgi:4-amino-4-deoxy-L-arabinose transferase-like glycosyltransferase
LSPRTFRWALVAVAVVAFAVRLAYVLIERRDFMPGGDAFFYHAGANLLADGEGFVSPFFYPERRVQAAEHPPLYMLFLSVPSVAGMTSVLTHQLWSCIAGTATVVVTGLLGREVGGARVGVGAAAVAAVYPNLWLPDGMLQAETLAALLTTVAVYCTYRFRADPTWPRVALVGVLCGLAALTRSELLLLVPLLVLPLAFARERTWRDRLVALAAGSIAAVVVVAPWAGYNATRFEHPVFLSAQIGPLLSAANCDSTYYGIFRGYFDVTCTMEADRRAGITADDDQSEMDLANRREAWRYIRGHLGKLPDVEAVRLLRIAGLYHPSEHVTIDSFVEGRERWAAWAGLAGLWVIEALAVAGAIVLHRRRTVPVWPLLAPVGVVVVTVLVTYASTRFRAAAEPALVVLAVVAVDAAIRRVWGQQAAPVSGASSR